MSSSHNVVKHLFQMHLISASISVSGSQGNSTAFHQLFVDSLQWRLVAYCKLFLWQPDKTAGR